MTSGEPILLDNLQTLEGCEVWTRGEHNPLRSDRFRAVRAFERGGDLVFEGGTPVPFRIVDSAGRSGSLDDETRWDWCRRLCRLVDVRDDATALGVHLHLRRYIPLHADVDPRVALLAVQDAWRAHQRDIDDEKYAEQILVSLSRADLESRGVLCRYLDKYRRPISSVVSRARESLDDLYRFRDPAILSRLIERGVPTLWISFDLRRGIEQRKMLSIRELERIFRFERPAPGEWIHIDRPKWSRTTEFLHPTVDPNLLVYASGEPKPVPGSPRSDVVALSDLHAPEARPSVSVRRTGIAPGFVAFQPPRRIRVLR